MRKITMAFASAVALLFIFLALEGAMTTWRSQDKEIERTINRLVDRELFVMAFSKHNPELAPAEAYAIALAVQGNADERGIDASLIASIIIIESHARPHAVSPKGAKGLMQVMPRMAKALGFKGDLFDIEDNIKVGAFILADNINRWGYHEGVKRYFWGNSEGDGTYLDMVMEKRKGLNESPAGV